MDTEMIVLDNAAELAELAEDNRELMIVKPKRNDEDPVNVYLAGLSPRSVNTMGGALDRVARIFLGVEPNPKIDPSVKGIGRYHIEWSAMRFQHVAGLRAQLQERYTVHYGTLHINAVRGVLRSAWKLGLMPAEDYHRAASVQGLKGETLPAGRHVPMGELSALLDTCDQSAGGIRDAAIISLLYGCGLRRAELVGADLADYDTSTGVLIVLGKGGKEREIPVSNGPADALADWIQVRGDDPGALFLGTGNRQRGGRLTSQAVYNMLRARRKAAGIPELSPHDFRRTFAGELLDRGADIVTVQKLMGHADVTTTARYDRRDEKAKRKAVDLLSVPYKRRTLKTG